MPDKRMHLAASRGRKPRLFHKQGHLERAFSLDPVQYLASVV